MKVYFISGLGADQRAFYKIKLPRGYQSVYLDWITPLANEAFADYAKRFSQSISRDEEFVLVGLSFGGMLASELAKIVSPKKLIIISSLSSYKELPWYFKLAGKLGIHRIISPSLYKHATIMNRFMGAGNKEMKSIVYSYVNNIDPAFIRWSLNVIVHWSHTERLSDLVHIHGSNDHLLPYRYVQADYMIKNGGHLMVMNKADEVNSVLHEVLRSA